MKVEQGLKPQTKVEPPIIADIGTETPYFQYIDSAQNYIYSHDWPMAEQWLLKAFKADPGNRDKGLSGRTYCDFSHYSGTALRITAAVTDETYAALKMCVEITDETYPSLKAALPECDCQRFSGENWCKITRRDATKENALQELCRASGLTMAEIVAFGDDAPDIGMLRLCGLGVAMGNAIPAVKVAADVVIGTNDEDGIAEWLEEWMKRMPYKELGGSRNGQKQTLDHTGDPV